ncbi:SPOR domain-containing protein [Halanaerobium praevalens]|uniref:Sporulation domain-containing protein n=1 Tax=Halanaerobium praevalens (strain ATCC 33744 / DSM 2228 / GSL) TaxID=572479 RepID=E3DMH5_HALPG|nr:SPOR domain-containing protein [Halanaerobium praevalens]ADO77383.1 Sporulation domain-containing protein [Halanaerobium praevalens DSM 2228]
MNKDEKGFSLIIIVVFMSIAALFIGYLAGSWLISFLVADDQNSDLATKVSKTEKVKEKSTAEINNSKNNLTAPDLDKSEKQTNAIKKNNSSKSDSNQSSESKFAVQIGAFTDYNNAVLLKEEIEKLGFKVKITDSSPHQVQVTNYSSRKEAESAAKELKSKGCEGFIVHLE